jgi:hypothetical protein
MFAHHGGKHRYHLVVTIRFGRQVQLESVEIKSNRNTRTWHGSRSHAGFSRLAAVMAGGIAAAHVIHVAAIIRHLLATRHLFCSKRAVRLHACHHRHSCYHWQQKTDQQLGDGFHYEKFILPTNHQQVYEQPEQCFPLNAARPSLAIIGTMISAAIGSAHHHPNHVFSSRPANNMAER